MCVFVWLIWEFSRFDFEDYFKMYEINPQIQKFDEQYKFGRNYDIGLAVKLFNKLQLGLDYSKNYIYPEFDFGKWVLAYTSELVLQNWMEIFEDDLQKKFGPNYWIYKYVYKSLVTLLIAETMNKKPYLFFDSDRAFYNQFVFIKISYIGF